MNEPTDSLLTQDLQVLSMRATKKTPVAFSNLSAGSYGTHKETVRFSTGLLGDHWGLQGRLSNIGSDGYIDRASSRLNSYFLQAGYFGDNTMDYASRKDMQQFGRTYNPCGQYTDANGQTAYYKNQTDNYHQQHYQLIWNQRIDRLWNLNAALHCTRGDGYYEQYMTNSDFKAYKEDDGTETRAMLDAMFVNDLDLSYTFNPKTTKRPNGQTAITIGITVYNLFNERYETNGSCSMNFRRTATGAVEAYNGGWAWATFSAQAPIHFLGHVSVNF